MTTQFEIRKQIPLPASPDHVWEAIATGPGLASWFGPLPSVDPAGDTTRTWEPGKHLSIQMPRGADGATHAYE